MIFSCSVAEIITVRGHQPRAPSEFCSQPQEFDFLPGCIGCTGVNLTPSSGIRAQPRLRDGVARCAGHGFDDVADGDDSGDRGWLVEGDLLHALLMDLQARGCSGPWIYMDLGLQQELVHIDPWAHPRPRCHAAPGTLKINGSTCAMPEAACWAWCSATAGCAGVGNTARRAVLVRCGCGDASRGSGPQVL